MIAELRSSTIYHIHRLPRTADLERLIIRLADKLRELGSYSTEGTPRTKAAARRYCFERQIHFRFDGNELLLYAGSWPKHDLSVHLQAALMEIFGSAESLVYQTTVGGDWYVRYADGSGARYNGPLAS